MASPPAARGAIRPAWIEDHGRAHDAHIEIAGLFMANLSLLA
jgi:hypothetical protein